MLDPEYLYKTNQISVYKYTRLMQQKELDKLAMVEKQEINDMKRKLELE